MECIVQGLVTGLIWGSLIGASKIKSAPIELKIGTGMLSTKPDTGSASVLRENDVIMLPRPFYYLLREKQGVQITLKISTILV